jgi:hypothetical protein
MARKLAQIVRGHELSLVDPLVRDLRALVRLTHGFFGLAFEEAEALLLARDKR